MNLNTDMTYGISVLCIGEETKSSLFFSHLLGLMKEQAMKDFIVVFALLKLFFSSYHSFVLLLFSLFNIYLIMIS